jgi:SAM-dependent methyltransferase
MYLANKWDSAIKKNHYNIYPSEIVVKFIFNYFKKNSQKKVLDLGCGAGNNLKLLADHGLDFYGVDSSKLAIKKARSFLKSKKIILSNFIDTLNFKDNFFDAIIDRMSLTHNTEENIDKTLINIKKKLKKNGLFLTMFFSNECSDLKYGTKVNKKKFHYCNFSKGLFKYCDIVFAPTLKYIKKKLLNIKIVKKKELSYFKILDVTEHRIKSLKNKTIFYILILQNN